MISGCIVRICRRIFAFLLVLFPQIPQDCNVFVTGVWSWSIDASFFTTVLPLFIPPAVFTSSVVESITFDWALPEVPWEGLFFMCTTSTCLKTLAFLGFLIPQIRQMNNFWWTPSLLTLYVSLTWDPLIWCAFEVDCSLFISSSKVMLCSSVESALSSGILSPDNIISETGRSFPIAGTSSWEVESLERQFI